MRDWRSSRAAWAACAAACGERPGIAGWPLGEPPPGDWFAAPNWAIICCFSSGVIVEVMASKATSGGMASLVWLVATWFVWTGTGPLMTVGGALAMKLLVP